MGPHHFKLGRVLGKGSYGKVFAITLKESKKFFAMKLLNKKDIIEKKMVKSILYERELLSSIEHPFIVNLYYAYQNEDELCMVVDLMTGGDLRFHLEKDHRFSEERVRFYACCCILCLEYLHSKNVIHRDLKPDNLLLDAEGYCHITDFNISVHVKPGTEVKNYAGTAPYMAPEIYKRIPYGNEVDYWSLGATLYELLMGKLPFDGTKDKLEALITGTTEVPFSSGLSQLTISFLQGLLERDPAKRLKSPGIRNHPFFQGIRWDDILRKAVVAPFVPDPRRVYVDASYDLHEQFQTKKKRVKLDIEEQKLFVEWDWVRGDHYQVPDYILELRELVKKEEEDKKKAPESGTTDGIAFSNGEGIKEEGERGKDDEKDRSKEKSKETGNSGDGA
eukprot:TRINITY_DN4661_c0_g1_i1.p1 TRINITY_DN4661_c0_g1~~TRINITY_DN4661_c0_g1_i1.p1  ORF type:complete len:391 (-),score=55.64 TRINITY_DN4661_c0_g1_i1:270-1442(-)